MTIMMRSRSPDAAAFFRHTVSQPRNMLNPNARSSLCSPHAGGGRRRHASALRAKSSARRRFSTSGRGPPLRAGHPGRRRDSGRTRQHSAAVPMRARSRIRQDTDPAKAPIVPRSGAQTRVADPHGRGRHAAGPRARSSETERLRASMGNGWGGWTRPSFAKRPGSTGILAPATETAKESC